MTLAALLLAGCAGYSPECVTGTGTKDCATGTLGHQQMTQEQEGEETLASIDDALPRLRSARFKRISRVPATGGKIAKRRPITESLSPTNIVKIAIWSRRLSRGTTPLAEFGARRN